MEKNRAPGYDKNVHTLAGGRTNMLDVVDIRINHIWEPQGVSGDIAVGWKLRSERRNVMQSGYELLAAKDDACQDIVYRSGKVDSGESANVYLRGIPWEPLRYYTIAVRVWDNHGENSPWRKTRILTALPIADWQARFITAERQTDRKAAPGTAVRTSFVIAKPVKEAFLVSTARGLYQAFLNGERIGRDELAPGWTSYNRRLLYQTYDVTELLREGENAVGVLLGAGWYKGDVSWLRRHNFYGDFSAFAGQLVIRYADGGEETIYSDGTWKGNDSPILHADVYDGETYDARREEAGWNCPKFDDSLWRNVSVLETNREILSPQAGCPIRIQEAIPVKEILTTPEGDTVLDFGQNLTGWVRFTVQGGPGDEVELHFFEALDGKGNVYTDNLRTAKQTIRYFCKGAGPETYQPHFTFFGFRYVRIRRWPEEKPDAAQFTAFVLHSDMETRGDFHCSNPLLNRLQSNIRWGLRGNSVGVPTDCPQRDERLGWTGDAQVFCKTACYLMDMTEFYRQWLCDLAADQRPDGGVAHVVPDVLGDFEGHPAYGASGWADVAVTLPWTLYQESGDPSIIRQQYGSMKAWAEYVESHNHQGIIQTNGQFGDWLALDAAEGSYYGATPLEYTSLVYHIHTCGLLSKMASIIGEQTDAKRYSMFREAALENYRKRYLLPNGKLRVNTQTAYAMALFFHLLPEQSVSTALRELLKLLKERDGHLSTGFLGTPCLLHALSEHGCAKEAYALLLKEDFPSWLYQVKKGATTVWEHWDGLKPDGSMWSADMNSFNHYAYGAVGQWLYEVCAGLRMDEAGYRRFTVRPHTGGGLDFAETSHESVYGTIRVRWERRNDEVVLSVQIPPNTAARIILEPTAEVVDAGGLDFTASPDAMQTEAGSGTWNMIYRT